MNIFISYILYLSSIFVTFSVKQHLFCSMFWLFPFLSFVYFSFTWEVLSMVWRYLWPVTALVLSSLSVSHLLTFFCLLKERGLFLYLLTLTAGCAVTLFQRLSSEDLPTGPWPLREICVWCAPCSRGMSCTHFCAIVLLLFSLYYTALWFCRRSEGSDVWTSISFTKAHSINCKIRLTLLFNFCSSLWL